MLGVLEIAGRGSGFLRRREAGYLPASGDVHVGERIIRQYGLRIGDEIEGETRPGSPGNDQKFRSEKLEDARNCANPRRNATRFVLGARPA
jgi:transcription termination factor Rho